MEMESDVEKNWRTELEDFISHWERETETIKFKTLNPQECDEISKLFQKDSDGLLVRRPPWMSEDEIYTRLEKLDNKLSSTLAMVCRSSDSI